MLPVFLIILLTGCTTAGDWLSGSAAKRDSASASVREQWDALVVKSEAAMQGAREKTAGVSEDLQDLLESVRHLERKARGSEKGEEDSSDDEEEEEKSWPFGRED